MKPIIEFGRSGKTTPHHAASSRNSLLDDKRDDIIGHDSYNQHSLKLYDPNIPEDEIETYSNLRGRVISRQVAKTPSVESMRSRHDYQIALIEPNNREEDLASQTSQTKTVHKYEPAIDDAPISNLFKPKPKVVISMDNDFHT